ncbi:DEAD/DEAH box helicase family protein [Candidatus Saccharibacteria bacterium]|nr:DEAD/DEAH box helicase family protein [Candidatus Saccharibacteria bacterium]
MAEVLNYQTKPRQIYAYTANGQKGIKVGDTTKDDVNIRIRQGLVNTPNPQYHVEFVDFAVTKDGFLFRDYDVHHALEDMGIKRFKDEDGAWTEWFDTDAATVRQAFLSVKHGHVIEKARTKDYPLRDEQKKFIRETEQYFRLYDADPKNKKAPHYLWNAKMRFGKTFTAYELAKKMHWKRILVLTYKPATAKQWRDDLEEHIDFEGWQFIKGGDYDWNKLNQEQPIVWFASYQDILGRDKGKTVKDKFIKMYEQTWDAMFVDEYHFGAWRDAAKELGQAKDDIDTEMPEEGDEEGEIEATMPLNVKHYIYLSGTPFRAIADGEFDENQISNWTYADEQRKKEEYVNEKVNPYAELPQIVMMTYRMPEKLREIAMQGEFNEFDLNTFFSAKKDENGEYIFKFENEVQAFLSILHGMNLEQNLEDGFSQKHPPIPYEDARLLSVLNHTFWFLPNVPSCKAMKRLLERDNFFRQYKIICAAGNDAGMGEDALTPVMEAISDDPFSTKTITLSCQKLTTGVTVKPWTGVFFLRNITAPETYFQAGFRAQSPWTYTNETGEKEIFKDTCYIFDFAPTRAIRLISNYVSGLGVGDKRRPEEQIQEFLHFLPILSYDGYAMQSLDAKSVLDISTFGIGSTMLARRWQSAKLVDVSNVVLEKVLNNEELMAALDKIEDFRNLRQDLTKVITSEKSINKTKKEGKEPTPGEKKQKKENDGFKKKLREKLLKFLTRVPVFMYLTEFREETLKDVITQLEPELFTRVTGLTVHDFELMCEIGVFNKGRVNEAVYQFRRFEDSSLNYVGGHDEVGDMTALIGGFDAIVTREEADEIIEGVVGE